jgi:hypothetical protein
MKKSKQVVVKFPFHKIKPSRGGAVYKPVAEKFHESFEMDADVSGEDYREWCKNNPKIMLPNGNVFYPMQSRNLTGVINQGALHLTRCFRLHRVIGRKTQWKVIPLDQASIEVPATLKHEIEKAVLLKCRWEMQIADSMKKTMPEYGDFADDLEVAVETISQAAWVYCEGVSKQMKLRLNRLNRTREKLRLGSNK